MKYTGKTTTTLPKDKPSEHCCQGRELCSTAHMMKKTHPPLRPPPPLPPPLEEPPCTLHARLVGIAKLYLFGAAAVALMAEHRAWTNPQVVLEMAILPAQIARYKACDHRWCLVSM